MTKLTRIEEVKRILEDNKSRYVSDGKGAGYFDPRTTDVKAHEIDEYYCHLFPQPLDDKDLGGKIMDSLHWTEYAIIGQGRHTVEGPLTQESEERIADQILALLQPKIEEKK